MDTVVLDKLPSSVVVLEAGGAGPRGPVGPSAYELAVASGYVGTQAEWLNSLKGSPGLSAYQVAVEQGFTGTEQEWLVSLVGPGGPSAYAVAVASGYVGSVDQWLVSLQGPSAYSVAVSAGFTGTQEQWLDSLVGPAGPQGPAWPAEGVQAAAESAAAQALGYKDAAESAMIDAATSASTATYQATQASLAASTASDEASQAANSAAQASTSATSAENFKNVASTQATQAADSAQASAASANQASAQAAVAVAQALVATAAASTAETAATEASTHANNAASQAASALDSSEEASAQAAIALASASTATTKALQATSAATQAASSASQAANSATSSANFMTSASASAATAITKATEAEASAAAAANSADSANTSKNLASGYSAAANQSATISSEQATLATAARAEAETYASSAVASAADAATSQGIAGTYATTAADASQAAQAAADDAVAVVTGGTASLTAAAGKIPIADASGKIDPAWLDPIVGVTAAALHRSPNAITALFVYDTGKDSDGGAWTERCQHTSWYNETLSGRWLGQAVSEAAARAVTGATTGDYFQLTTDGKFYKLNAGSGTTEVFRGNKRDFPKLAAIVAESASITIYDLTEPGRPMWMRFDGKTDYTTFLRWYSNSGVVIAVAALNGVLFVGGIGGCGPVSFPGDDIRVVGSARYLPKRKVADRNATGSVIASGGDGYAFNNVSCLAVSMTLLPDAPVDPTTGLRVPTIAVATGGGVSVIQHSGVVRNSSSNSNFYAIHISPAMLSATRTSDATLYTALAPGLLGASFALSTRTGTQAPGFGVGNTNGLIRTTRSELTRRSATAGLVQRLRAWEADVSKSVAATITDSYNTGHMVGDIRRAYLADVDTASIGPSTELVTNGDFGTGKTGWSFTGPDGLTVAANVATFTSSGTSNNSAYQSFYTTVGKTYSAAFRRYPGSGGLIRVGTTATGFDYVNTASSESASTDFHYEFVAKTTTAFFSFGYGLAGSTTSIGNISVTEVVADRSYKAQRANILGTLTKTAVATGAQLVAYSGFSASNYLQEPYSADLDFGVGEWTCSAWITVPTGNAAAGTIAARAYSSGASITLGIDATNKLTATAYDGTTTRTVTTTGAYNTATGVKAEATYRAGRLAILVNGVEVAVTHGTPLLTLNNSNAVLTIGNSYALDAPFPGSIALLKFSATVPTAEQSLWMYEQEKQMFRAGAQVCLPDSGAVVDLAYDDATDKWIAASASNRSEWSGLVRTSTTAVPAGSYSKTAAGSGVLLTARSTTSPGVDVTLPELGLRRELARRAEAAARLAAQPAVLDYVGGFTATTTNGGSALTSVSGLSVPGMVNLVGCQVTGSGIPASTTITGISGTGGTTIYLSAAATAGASGVQISLVDFPLPTGLEAKTVSVAGALKQEGASATWTRQYDGFREAVRFGTAPGYNAWVQITAVRSVS